MVTRAGRGASAAPEDTAAVAVDSSGPASGKAVLDREAHQLRAAAMTGLLPDAVKVRMHGLDAHEELVGYGLVWKPCAHQPHDCTALGATSAG